MKPNNLEGRSRGSSFRRRALTLVGVSALTLSGVGAAVFGASQAFAVTGPASITGTSSSYSIGTGAVGSLAVSSSNSTLAKTAIYTIGFTATDGISAGSNINLTMSDATTAGVVTGSLKDNTTSAVQSVSIPQIAAGNLVSIPVPAAVTAGDSVTLQFGSVTQGSSADISANLAITSATVTVSTTQDTSPVKSAAYTLAVAAASAIPTASASPATQGSIGVWTLGSFGVYDSTTGATAIKTLAAGSTLTVTFTGALLPTLPLTDYTITDTPSSGTATTQNPSAVAANGPGSVIITTSKDLTVGDTLTLAVSGVTNPSAGLIAVTLTVTSAAAPSVGDDFLIVAPGQTATHTFPDVTITGSATSVTGVSISASPNNASTSTANNTSTYTADFTATTALAVAAGNNIVVQLASGTAVAAVNAIVTDTTAGTSGAATPSLSPSTGSSTNDIGTILTPIAIAKGDVVSVQLFGVINPTTTGTFTGQVSTTADSVAVSASYTLVLPATTPGKITVSLTSTLAGGSANYTITNLNAGSSALPAGSMIYIGTAAVTDTQFPTVPSNYQITDLTSSSGTAVAAEVTPVTVAASSVAGAPPAFNGVVITTTNAISAKDNLTITISGVINPTTGGGYTLEFSPLVASTVAVTPTVTTAPNAATTGSSGSLVNVSGTIYVYAGGVAFGIPTPAEFNAISASVGNPTVVTASSVTTTGAVAPGTLVQVVGSPQINVVGSGGTYYGFSSGSQFLSDGYSFANVIQIPSFGSLTVGSGTTPSAASTAANGSLVNVSGTIYVYAGGVAIGIPTPAAFNSISAAEGNPTVVTASSVTISGNMAAGTLVQVVGSPQVNVVTSTGTQVGFATASEFTGDGYSWAKVVMIP